MIPNDISNYIQKAIEKINQEGIPNSRKSYRYFLQLNGKLYPPKYVISVANVFLNGEELSPEYFNAIEAKDFFIRRNYEIIESNINDIEQLIKDEEEESLFAEGKEYFKTHRALERDTSISKKAKKHRLIKTGELRCDVCDFSFSEAYGDLGIGFIEAHHTVPVSKIRGKRRTKESEIALVCSNCHRMFHRSKPVLSIVELKKIVDKYNKINK